MIDTDLLEIDAGCTHKDRSTPRDRCRLHPEIDAGCTHGDRFKFTDRCRLHLEVDAGYINKTDDDIYLSVNNV